MRIFVSLILLIVFLFCFSWIFSYDTDIAHPYLTEKAVELFNQSSEIQISQQQLEWLKQGAIEEDTPIRWMNHFYNPLTGNGLWGFSSAKDWSRENIKQSLYPKGNQTWQKAIESYAKGDKKEAFIALGHILHLTEDMTVPAHTRNDAHPEGDPYEEWVKSNANKEIKIESISKLNNIDEFFDFLAGYSNKYFLSKDTIDKSLLKDLKIKTIVSDDKMIDCLLSYEENNKEFCIISSDKNFINPQKRIYYFTKINHSDYYSFLAPKAVSYGAGVIDLFFQEAEKERQKQQEKSWLEKLKEKIFSSEQAVRLRSPQAAGPGFVLNPQPVITSTSNTEPPLTQTRFGSEASTEFQAPQAGNEDGGHSVATMDNMGNEPQHTEPATPGVVAPKFAISLPYAGFGGGGGGSATSMSGVDVEDDEPLPVIDITPPDVLLSVAGCLNTNASSTCLLATPPSGGLNIFWSSSAEDLDYFEININGAFSTTTATSTIVFIEDNSSNIFSVRAVDTSGNWSEPQTITVVIYSMPVVINEVAWMGTPASGSDEWIELYNRTNYDIDLSGWQLKTFDNGPNIVFGENSENKTTANKIIPAKGYYLIERTDDNTISDSDISADWYGSFGNGLSGSVTGGNVGEVLVLSYASTTIDQTVLCGYGWCPGFNYGYRSMERYDPDIAGTDQGNWSYNNQVIANGKDAKSNPISGTPKARNSVNYLIAKGASIIVSDITLKKSNSPYVVAGMNNDSIIQSFQASSTLTIEQGVVVKFYGGGMNFYENAKIIAKGTKSEPIIFTHFYDDEYGGDLNNDAATTSPLPGGWFGVEIKTNNQDSVSVFDNVIFRYGGGYTDLAGSRANLYLENNSAKITNSIFEYSKVYGLALVNSTSTVSNNIFRDNNQGFDSAGLAAALVVSGGNSVIEKKQFSGKFQRDLCKQRGRQH